MPSRQAPLLVVGNQSVCSANALQHLTDHQSVQSITALHIGFAIFWQPGTPLPENVLV